MPHNYDRAVPALEVEIGSEKGNENVIAGFSNKISEKRDMMDFLTPCQMSTIFPPPLSFQSIKIDEYYKV